MRDSDLETAAAVERSLLIRGNGRLREHDTQIEFPCPVPGHDDRHPSATYNRADGVWTCFSCGSSGGLTWGDVPLAPLLGLADPLPGRVEDLRQWRLRTERERADAEARERDALQTYWRERRLADELRSHADVLGRLVADGITTDAADHFGFGYRDWFGAPALSIPWTVRGELRALQYRLLADTARGGRYRWHEGSHATVFNADAVLAPEDDWLLVVEGAKKAACLWGHGLTSVCAVANKCGWRPEYGRPMRQFARVVFLPDPDAVAEARAWSADVPGSRVAVLPSKPDDLLVASGGDVDMLWAFVQTARIA